MRVATFGLEEALEQALAAAGPLEPVRCSPESPEASILPAALGAAEAALGSAAAEAVLIAGDHDWALAAALACAKAPLAFARIGAGGWQPGPVPAPDRAHVDRVADLRICETEESLAGLERAGLAERAVVASGPDAIAAAVRGWLTSVHT